MPPDHVGARLLNVAVSRAKQHLAIMGARKSIIVFSGFVTPQRVAEFGDLFRMKVRCVTRPPYANGTMAPELGKEALDALEGIGCVVDCRSRIHQKVVLIDNEIVWHGSLNVLSHSHRTEESMTRVVNTGVAETLSVSMCKRRVSARKAAGAVTEPENPRCGKCGARTVYAEGPNGPYFYCENRQAENGCRWSVNLDRAERGGSLGSVSGHGTRQTRRGSRGRLN